MIGYGWSGRGDEVGEVEFMRLAAGPDGVPVYFATPNGAATVGFRLVHMEANVATFENPAHDFPQRISYRRTGDVLVATVSAVDGSHAMSWTYRRR